MSHLDKRRKSPPFLELSNSTLQLLEQNKHQLSSINFDNVLTLWTTLIKSSDFIKNGKRLENISWRVVNRNLLLKNDFSYNDFSTLIDISTNQPILSIEQSNGLNINRPTTPRAKRIPSNNSMKTQQKQYTQTASQVLPPAPALRQPSTLFPSQRHPKPSIPASLFQQPQRPSLVHSNSRVKSKSQVEIQKGTNEITAEVSNSDLDSDLESDEEPGSGEEYKVSLNSKQPPYQENIQLLPNSNGSLFSKPRQPRKKVNQEPTKISLTQSNLDQQQELIEKQEGMKKVGLFGNRSNHIASEDNPRNIISTNKMFYIENSPSPESKDLENNTHHQQEHPTRTSDSRIKSPLIPREKGLKQSQTSNVYLQQQQQQISSHSLFAPQRSPTQNQHQSHAQEDPGYVSNSNQHLHHREKSSPLPHPQDHYQRSQQQHQQQHPNHGHQHHNGHNHHNYHHQQHAQYLGGDPVHQSHNHTGQEDGMDHLYQQQMKYNSSHQSAFSPKSDTQKSQASLFNNNNQNHTTTQKIMFSSEDDFSDGSDWSSLSDDSEFDDDDEEDHLDFDKKADFGKKEETVGVKRSLLSGLFLDKLPQEAEASGQQKSKRSSSQIRSSKLIISPHLPSAAHSNRGIDNLEMTPRGTLSAASASLSNVNVSAIPSPPSSDNNRLTSNNSSCANGEVGSSNDVQTAGSMLQQQQQLQQRPQLNRGNSNGFHNMVSKSAISLASFFANNRRPQTGGEQHQYNGHYDKHHESNAPPTAATLLPTALATHMFLPTMNLHQQRGRGRQPADVSRNSNGHVNNDSKHVTRSPLMNLGSTNRPPIYRQNSNPSSLLNRHHFKEQVADHESKFPSPQENEEDNEGGGLNVPGTVELNNHSGHEEPLQDVEYSSSVKSNTTSIDIPDSSQLKPPSFLAGHNSHSESHQNHSQSHQDPAKPKLETRVNSFITKLSPSSTVYEMLSKELPSNLVDSINNENKLIHASASASNLSSLNDPQRPSFSRHGSSKQHHSSNITSSNYHNNSSGKFDATTEESESDESNIIANGIMGNKLKLLPTVGPEGSSGLQANDGKDIVFIDDKVVIESAKLSRSNGTGGSSSGAQDWDEDSLNYHAKGW